MFVSQLIRKIYQESTMWFYRIACTIVAQAHIFLMTTLQWKFSFKAYAPKPILIEDTGSKTWFSSKLININFIGEELAKITSEWTNPSIKNNIIAAIFSRKTAGQERLGTHLCHAPAMYQK